MKNYKRAERRHRDWYAFKRKVDDFINRAYGTWGEYQTVAEWKEGAYKGEDLLNLRTTNKYCNCSMCSHRERYKRPTKSELLKDIYNQIDD